MCYVSNEAMEQQADLIKNYIKQVGSLLTRESVHKEEKENLLQRIGALEQEITAMKHSRSNHHKEKQEMDNNVRQAER